MRALVYHGPGQKAWEEVPKPVIVDDTDAIVRVDATTICGTDLHILKGDVPAVDRRPHPRPRGRRHRRVGRRRRRRTSRVGDRVLVSCITACGACRFCREGTLRAVPRRRRLDPRPHDRRHPGRVRARAVRRHLHLLRSRPASPTRQLLMLADILPTGYEVGVLNGQVQPGDVVAIVGAGPIGLSAIMGARLYSPAPHRRHRPGRQPPRRGEAVRRRRRRQQQPRGSRSRSCRQLTDGLGADVAIEAVGVPATFELATPLVRPGGHVANIGVHGEPATLHLEDLWIRDVTITTGLVDTYSTPTLLRLSHANQIDAAPLRDPPLRARRVRGGLRRVRPRRATPAPSRSCSHRR